MDHSKPAAAADHTLNPQPDIAAWPDTVAFRRRRHDMVRQQIIARGIRNAPLIRAMARLPRHLFTRPEDCDLAYDDMALPSDQGQTISQPMMVAVMTAQLDVQPGQRILEIGTGTGYQTAILAMLCGQVYTVEYVPQLAREAQARLHRLGFGNIYYCIGDGSNGWDAHSPYDRILVTAGAAMVPEPLIQQLVDGGKMIIPVGNQTTQVLQIIERKGKKITTADILDCRFVPLLGKHGWH